MENDSLPSGAVMSFVNTNDGTCEGIVYTDTPAFSVQFHPEASSGPLDTGFLFDEFVRLINDRSHFASFTAATERIDAISYFAGTIKRTKEEQNTIISFFSDGSKIQVIKRMKEQQNTIAD